VGAFLAEEGSDDPFTAAAMDTGLLTVWVGENGWPVLWMGGALVPVNKKELDKDDYSSHIQIHRRAAVWLLVEH